MAKKSTLGLEVEYFLIDRKGRIANTADSVIERSKKSFPNAAILPEIGRNMIEIGSLPSEKAAASAQSLLLNISAAVKAASEEKNLLLPMATYPGAFTPSMREKGLYQAKKKIFQEKYELTGKCTGFHLHHSLPEGSFDATSKNIKAVLSSKTKKSLVEVYNLCIALDPVLTTLMQSSPFYEGRHIGKDSRIIVYRGGGALNYEEGLYGEHLEESDSSPRYCVDDSELLDKVVERYTSWKSKLRETAPEMVDSAQYESVLETNWTPIKINPHGTIEIRGMDTNFPSLLFSLAVAVKYLLQDVYEHSLHVVPSGAGIAEYFKEENSKLYVPPDDYVRKKLQYLSAYMGMENSWVNSYCSASLKLVKALMPVDSKQLLKPFQEMVDEKKTVSDHILADARKLGYTEGEALPKGVAGELALRQANRFIDDLDKTQAIIEKNMKV